jgi:hypothetical protein
LCNYQKILKLCSSKTFITMALLHRALIAWFVALVFLILLVLQLDHRTQWSWFLVLVPIWFWDALIIVLLALHIFSQHCSQHLRSRPWYFCKKLVTLMSPILLKITFQCLLCNRLDSPSSGIALYYIFIPLWLLLLASMVKLMRILIPVCRE